METDQLIAYLNKTLPEAQQQEVENWIHQSESNRHTFEQVAAVWEASYRQPGQIDTQQAWKKVRSKIKPATNVRRLWMQRAGIAASIALLIAAAFWFWPTKVEWELISSLEHPVEMSLTDGSLVSLNGNSQLSYPAKFSKRERRVSLEGEAFFDIARMPEKPFLIEAGMTEIQVLGTSFNVMAHPDSAAVRVQVNSGTVAFYSKDASNDKLILRAGEAGIFNSEIGALTKIASPDPNRLAWHTKVFSFDNTPLNQVIDQLNEVYDTEIKVDNKAILDCPLTATFEKQQPEQILEVLSYLLNIQITKEKDGFLITGGTSCE